MCYIYTYIVVPPRLTRHIYMPYLGNNIKHHFSFDRSLASTHFMKTSKTVTFLGEAMKLQEPSGNQTWLARKSTIWFTMV